MRDAELNHNIKIVNKSVGILAEFRDFGTIVSNQHCIHEVQGMLRIVCIPVSSLSPPLKNNIKD
jgi:hypothetical protein